MPHVPDLLFVVDERIIRVDTPLYFRDVVLCGCRTLPDRPSCMILPSTVWQRRLRANNMYLARGFNADFSNCLGRSMLRYLLFQAKNLIMLPVRLITSPKEALGSTWSESNRNKALILGLPALIVASVAGLAIGSVQLLNQENLVDHYKSLFEKESAALVQFQKELTRQQNVKSVSNLASSLTDEQKAQLNALRESQKIYLDKLIALDPENDVHRFALAELVFARGDQAHAYSILNDLAPEDAPGYQDAHFILAKNYFELRAGSRMELIGNLKIAEKHIDHVLTRDDTRMDAKLLKARILSKLEQYPEAYKLYEELFDLNPNFYREMAELNRRMGREENNDRLLRDALKGLRELSSKSEQTKDETRWIIIETGIANVQQKLKQFTDSENRLTKKIKKYAADPDGGPRRVFLQKLLASTYIVWANDVADPNRPYSDLSESVQEELLALYSKAFKNERSNALVLQSLARLSLSEIPEIAEAARQIYDPKADIDAPATVLNQLGNHALMKKRFSDAIRYYERAREKAPRDTAVLNNLAYSYLVAEVGKRNSERALRLINEAIRNLPRSVDPYEKSKFLHTRATALKQMDRLQEALADFEQSLRVRRRHADTLQSLIECYEGLNKLPPELYVETLREVIDEEKLSDFPVES